jgi:hypothetical protein
MTFVITAFFFMGTCSYEEDNSDSNKKSTETKKAVSASDKAIRPTDKKEEPSDLNIELALFEKLQAKYEAKGFESFCVLKADLDSIFLISDYMANVIYGKDNFSAAKTALAEWIEKDKLEAYYRRHNLSSDDLNKDLFEFTASRNTLCNIYLERRYQSDQNEINNVIHSRLAKEAHKRYTP